MGLCSPPRQSCSLQAVVPPKKGAERAEAGLVQMPLGDAFQFKCHIV
jgi:hypothetical protein